jgi:hypothetical protein
MADPAKYKSVSINTTTYSAAVYLQDKLLNSKISISKAIENCVLKEAKKLGYKKNGKHK